MANTRYEVRTFGDIVRTVCETLKVQSSDTETINRIKRNINMVYLNHVVPASTSWTWLDETITLSVEPYFAAGTASVQQNVATVTLSQIPGASMVGRFFSVDGNNEVYRVATHTPTSATLTLEGPYTGATNTAATYKLWTDKVVLPSDCMKVREVITPNASAPLMRVALQQFRKHQIAGGAVIGSPSYYAEGPMEEPSPYVDIDDLPAVEWRESAGLTKTIHFSGDPSTTIAVGDRIHVESPNSYTYAGDFIVSAVTSDSISYTGRIPLEDDDNDTSMTVQFMNTANTSPAPTILVFPCIMQQNQRINMVVDYQAYPSELIADRDEPRIPREHRSILVDGAMWLSADRETDLERSAVYRQYFEMGLQRMLGRSASTAKTPTMRVSNSYLQSKSGNRFGRSRYNSAIGYEGWSGNTGGSSAAPTATGTPNSVAVFDENGYLIGSSDINLDLLEYLIGTQAASSELVPDNATTSIDSFSATTYRTANVQYAVVRGASIRAGMFIITTEGTSVATADYAATEIGTTGVDFSSDLTGGNFRLLVTTDSQGVGATVYYKVSLV